MYLLYWLFLWCSGEFWDKSLAEKLTQEQVLEELGVKIETKGKKEVRNLVMDWVTIKINIFDFYEHA